MELAEEDVGSWTWKQMKDAISNISLVIRKTSEFDEIIII